ncbi:hypothetical protein N7540_001693 [Penicillium herquei]|nr:hypothetical protein N7540_001693 [Penicillium herquei]
MVLFYLCYNQISTNLVSQAGEMKLGGFPNDAIQILNAISCIIIGPIIQKGLYPLLHRRNIDFGPIARITAAFFLMGASMAYAAGVQRLIYSRGPCFNMPLSCPESDGGKIPNSVSVWIQSPLYIILAVSEIFGFATVSEYAYSKAPKNMKALVQALTQFTACIASAAGMGISPASHNPNMVTFYAVLAGTTAFISIPFWWLLNKYDKIDEILNRLDQVEEE